MEEPRLTLGLRPATAGLKGSDAHLANTTPRKNARGSDRQDYAIIF